MLLLGRKLCLLKLSISCHQQQFILGRRRPQDARAACTESNAIGSVHGFWSFVTGHIRLYLSLPQCL